MKTGEENKEKNVNVRRQGGRLRMNGDGVDETDGRE